MRQEVLERVSGKRVPGGYTLVELVVSVALSSMLMVGLASAMLIGISALDGGEDVQNRSEGSEVLSEVLRDLQLAKSFTEKTATAVTFTVPDRDQDTFPETIRYSWAGSPGDPLLYKYNTEAAKTIAANVHNFDLSFLERSMGSGGGGGNVVFESFEETKQSANVSSTTISRPSGTSDDDLLIAALVTDGNTSGSMSPPGGGWNEIIVEHYASQVTLGVWWKLASSEPASYQFTWSGLQESYGWIMRFSGHDTASPIHVTSDATGYSSNPESPAVVTTLDNTMILRIGGFDDDNTNTDDAGLAGHTTITADESGPGGGTCSGAAGYVIQALAGSSGTATFDLTSTERAKMLTIAIAPGGCP